jgi:hypothetical protein
MLDDMYFATGLGVLSTKQERVQLVAKSHPASLKVSDERYRMLGDTAIHTYRTDGVAADGQKAAQRVIEVWAKQSGAWKLAAVQLATIAKP